MALITPGIATTWLPGLCGRKRSHLPGSCPQCGDGSVSSGAFGNGMLFQAGGSTVINGVGYRGVGARAEPGQRQLPVAARRILPRLFLAWPTRMGWSSMGPVRPLRCSMPLRGTRLYSYTTGGYLYAAPSVSNGQVYTGGTDDNRLCLWPRHPHYTASRSELSQRLDLPGYR